LFIFSTPVLIRHLWQLKTVVFLNWCLKFAILLEIMCLVIFTYGIMQSSKRSYMVWILTLSSVFLAQAEEENCLRPISLVMVIWKELNFSIEITSSSNWHLGFRSHLYMQECITIAILIFHRDLKRMKFSTEIASLSELPLVCYVIFINSWMQYIFPLSHVMVIWKEWKFSTEIISSSNLTLGYWVPFIHARVSNNCHSILS
jgi:hypothetical protein